MTNRHSFIIITKCFPFLQELAAKIQEYEIAPSCEDPLEVASVILHNPRGGIRTEAELLDVMFQKKVQHQDIQDIGEYEKDISWFC